MLNRNKVVMHKIINTFMQPCRMKRNMDGMCTNLQGRNHIGLQRVAHHQ